MAVTTIFCWTHSLTCVGGGPGTHLVFKTHSIPDAGGVVGFGGGVASPNPASVLPENVLPDIVTPGIRGIIGAGGVGTTDGIGGNIGRPTGGMRLVTGGRIGDPGSRPP